MKANKIHLRVDVYPDSIDKPRSRSHCSIALRILESDPDVCNIDVRVNVPGKEDRIAFSRYSTRLRYYFILPEPAKDYVNTLDGGKKPSMFKLVLRESDLIKPPSFSGIGWGWDRHAIDPGSQPNRADRTTRPIPA